MEKNLIIPPAVVDIVNQLSVAVPDSLQHNNLIYRLECIIEYCKKHSIDANVKSKAVRK